MSQVYRYISNVPGTITFGNVANADNTLKISQSKSSVGDKNVQTPVLRNTWTLRTPQIIDLTPDQPGSCNKARVTRVTEIRTSGPQVSKVQVLADLAELYRIVLLSKEQYGSFDGFLPPISATFEGA